MDLRIADMMAMQTALHQLHESEWFPLEPAFGQHSILYMIEEIGEAIAVLKKKGDQAVMHDASVRAAFLEELADVLMYYTDVLLRYHITPEEIAEAYIRKHEKNMGRNFAEAYKEKYHG